jgi:hypothetical protein
MNYVISIGIFLAAMSKQKLVQLALLVPITIVTLSGRLNAAGMYIWKYIWTLHAFVCLCICLFVYLRICVFAYLRICVFAYLRICVFAYLRICVFAYLHICVFAYLRICVFAYLHIWVFPDTYGCYMHLLVCVFAYLHICVFAHLSVSRQNKSCKVSGVRCPCLGHLFL